jgi:hypothetical protein
MGSGLKARPPIYCARDKKDTKGVYMELAVDWRGSKTWKQVSDTTVYISWSQKENPTWARVHWLAWGFYMKPQIYWAAASNTRHQVSWFPCAFREHLVFMEQSYILSVLIFPHDCLGCCFFVLPVDHFSDPLSVLGKPRKNSQISPQG